MQTRPCWVEIDTSALEDNYRLITELAGPETECLAVVKANAYGHGLSICGPAAARAGARWLGVTSVEEGAALRAICPGSRILVIGGPFAGQADAFIQNGLTPVVWHQEHLATLTEAAAGLPANTLPVHLEMDTGMSRQGAGLDELGSLLRWFKPGSPLRLEAVMTHLYGSDEAHSQSTVEQLTRLEEALRQIAAVLPEGEQPHLLSVGASAALLGGEADAVAELAARWKLRPMLRLGLALYGVTPRYSPDFAPGEQPPELAQALRQLRPVLAWKTQVASVRQVPAGATVGYNGTFIAGEPMRLALVPAGYADGLDRRLGNNFSLLVRGQRAPVVGRVSMDHAVLDITEIDGVQAGDEVVILGRQGAEQITAFDQAEACETIPWEVFTRITARVQRRQI